jgi:hypothetical protein
MYTRKLMVDPDKTEVVRQVFRIKKKHPRMTLDEIASTLYETGFRGYAKNPYYWYHR